MADLTPEASGSPGPDGERILVVNCGSSSLKYACFETGREGRSVRGKVERLGNGRARLAQRGPGGEIERQVEGDDLHAALEAMLAALGAEGVGRRPAVPPTIAAHRVVHGGERFVAPTRVDDAVLAEIEALDALAPLHNPAGVVGIRALRTAFPGVPQVAVFDTAFHATLPERAFLYGLPFALYERDGVRRYGFHGTSHAWVCARAAEHLGRPLAALRVVSCHLGSGASLCAVEAGRSVDTSMGMTPNEGLVMGTRSGDLDPGIVSWLGRRRGLDAGAVDDLLNHRSGLLGLSGLSSDMREIERAAAAGEAGAQRALDVYCYRLRKYLGAYAAALGGLDAIVFTGGVGQGSRAVRERALAGLGFLGIDLDGERNRSAPAGAVTRISRDGAPVAVLVVPTDEERMIAQQALRAGATPAA